MNVNPSTRLTFGRIMLYSLASAGLNILSITVSTWILYFYAPPPDSGRIQYLPVTLVGVLLTITTLWDAFIDPLIGHWSDNLRSRWGRRRPFLILGAPVVAAMVVLIWLPPGGGTLINALFFVFITIAYFTSFSLVGIPYDATMPEMAPEAGPRVVLSYWKGAFGIVGVLIGSLVAAPLFQSIGPVAMGAVVGGVALVTIWGSLFGLRESARPPGVPMGVWEGLRVTLRNQQFMFIFISTLFVHVAYQMLLANLPYFVTLVLGRSEGDVAILQGVLILVIALTGPLWALWHRKLSQRTLINISMAALGLVLAVGFFVGVLPGIPALAQGLVFMVLIGATLGGYLIIIYAMMGNVVDYDEMLTGRRREAVYYGTFSFALGLGIAVGTLVLPLLLQSLGYTRENPLGVRAAFPVMAVCMAAGYIIFQKYRLGDTPEETRKNMGLDQ